MRVLVTDVTSESGRTLARRLLAAGHEVVGLATEPHRYLDTRVALADDLPSAISGCQVVVLHADASDHAAVGTAARAAGARVLATVQGHDRAVAETLQAADVPHLLVRVAPLVGRRVDAGTCATLRAVLRSRRDLGWQLLHHDDLDRFLVWAVGTDHTGEIELAAEGTVTSTDARAALERVGRPARLPGRSTRTGGDGVLDGRLATSWGFRPGWSAAEALADAARGLTGRRVARDGVARPEPGAIPLRGYLVPHRVPAQDGHPLQQAGPEALTGELDDLIDPRFPVYSATNTSEALPGPMTPLTLDLHTNGIRLANETMADILVLDGPARDQFVSRVVSVYGHHVYLNASVSVISATNMPGWDEDSMRADVFGNLPDEWEMMPLGRPPLPEGLAKGRAGLAAVRRTIATARRYRDAAERVNAAARAEVLDADAIAGLTDERLEAHARLWRDRLNQSWAVAATGVLMVGSATAIHERKHSGADLGIDLARLESARPMLAVERLAALCRDDDALQALARSGDVGGARAHSPAFAAALDEELAAVGHRGPGECELVNPSFSDRPALLCTAAGNAATRPAPRRVARVAATGRTARLAAGATIARERARDAVVRYNHGLRLATRVRTERLVDAGVLLEPDDGFFLTFDELFDLPADAAGRVARRRAERARLSTVAMPIMFTGRWTPSEGDAVSTGEAVTGLGVAAGVAEGPVKVIASPDDDIEPGDVLVAAVTDTGHTAMFAYAAAVVTDIGGAASHAAIVAREFGIPCVVDTHHATRQLTDGQLVRVDGAAGTVTVLSDELSVQH